MACRCSVFCVACRCSVRSLSSVLSVLPPYAPLNAFNRHAGALTLKPGLQEALAASKADEDILQQPSAAQCSAVQRSVSQCRAQPSSEHLGDRGILRGTVDELH